MTYHDASTRFGDRAHFPSMGSQLPKHIPGRGPGICLLEESQANPYGNRWFRGTWNSRYRKVGTAQFRMRICFLWGKLLGWFSFAKEKSRLVNQNYLQCSEFAEIYWYLFDCNFAKIFAWLNWPWIFFTILVVGMGRWNHSRQVMPWWPSRLSEGFFPESSYFFCRLFGGSDFAYFKPREINYFGYVCLKKKGGMKPLWVELCWELKRIWTPCWDEAIPPALEDSIPFWVAHVLQFLEYHS